MQDVASERGLQVEERNFHRDALTESELDELIELAGGVAAVISPRNAAVKAHGWAQDPPSKAEFLPAAAADNKMIRRPILVAGARVVVGNDADGIREALQAYGA